MVHSLVVVQAEEQLSQRVCRRLPLRLSAVVCLCWEKLKTYREVCMDTIRFHNEVVCIELFYLYIQSFNGLPCTHDTR